MINEGNFLNTNKLSETHHEKQYTDEEILERISAGIDLDNDFALYLLGKNETIHYLASYLDRFQDLNQEVAIKLIEGGEGQAVASYVDRFQGLDKEVAIKLIESGYGWGAANNLDKFQGLNQEIAFKLIEGNAWSAVASNLDKFQDLNHQEVVFKLIERGRGVAVAGNLDKFQGLDHQEIALKLIERGRGVDVASSLNKFQGLNQEIAIKLIEAGIGDVIALDLDKFQGLNQEGAFKLIESGRGDVVASNLDKFKLTPQTFYQSVKEKYSDFIAEVETKIPKLDEQLAKSPELLIDILTIKNNFSKLKKSIKKNPFLSKALEESPRYGSKLILKYHEFDKTAQKNIKELFGNEKKILQDNPDIDIDSVQFRQLMQEKLMSFANNKAIFNKLEKRGVNGRKWLNYDEQAYFVLGEQENVKFSDQIKTPISRIKETLTGYQDSVINTFSDYKIELQSSFVTTQEAEDLKKKIEELQQIIALEKDDKKIQGMQKGLASLEAKEATLKPASVWDKVQSDIFRLKSMIENIFKFHDVCVQIETNIETIKDRKELIKEKDNLEKNKTQLRDNFKEFELFFESYETKLQELIIPSLGQERSDSLLQEIKETIGEELNHYDTDKNTLKNIFNEKNKNELYGREMKISIASRSTRDLYLGNYCPCCICIDSKYHGAESPIADYVTDLGIQNIVVYDEKTNTPVVACWTFIGEYSPNGERIMVIDNIEANTDYTNNYPEQLKQIIAKYINDYAKTINIKTIIQGAHNNDLEVFRTSEVKMKLGGLYNRSGGYFLEAENKNKRGI